MNPVFIGLGILDAVAGVCLFFPSLAGSLLLYIAFYALAKGIFSLMISIGSGYYGDWMGVADVVTGSLLMLTFFGFSYDFFRYVGILQIAKGLYCTVMPIIYK
jgi:hypothetical protein